MALESFPKISPANFSPENDLIQVYSKKGDYVGVINPSYIGGSTSPSGVAGAIQFSNGSAFASDASNLFWDDTNNRLGVGTNAPSTTLDVVGQTTFSDNALFSTDFKSIGRDLNNSSIRFASVSSEIRANISTGGQFHVYNAGSGTSRFGVSSGGQTTISGGGSTSATTSLLVQNSAGTELLKVQDNGTVTLSNAGQLNVPTGGILSGGGVKANDNSWGIGWQSPSVIGMRGDTGRIGFSSDAMGSGAVDTAISRNGAGILEVNNGTKGTLASINVASYRVNGTVGFTGTGSYTNFTIVGGIITNAS
jgi:hypothetical protein